MKNLILFIIISLSCIGFLLRAVELKKENKELKLSILQLKDKSLELEKQLDEASIYKLIAKGIIDDVLKEVDKDFHKSLRRLISYEIFIANGDLILSQKGKARHQALKTGGKYYDTGGLGE